MKRRKSLDPQATRYRIAVTALAKAERRKAAAEKSIAELTRKVRAFERRMSAEKRAGIAEADAARMAEDKMRKEKWREATRVLTTAAKVAGTKVTEPEILMNAGKRRRRLGMAVELREGACLAWDFRDGFKTGRWTERFNRSALRPLDQARDVDVVRYMPAVEWLCAVP